MRKYDKVQSLKVLNVNDYQISQNDLRWPGELEKLSIERILEQSLYNSAKFKVLEVDLINIDKGHTIRDKLGLLKNILESQGRIELLQTKFDFSSLYESRELISYLSDDRIQKI